MIELDHLLALETAVWNALQSGDAEADGASLSPDFLGVYPSGFADRFAHVDLLADGPTVESFEILDPRMVTISDEHALLVYRADYREPGNSARLETMFVSSLWSLRDGEWTNVFSQDTPSETPDIDESEQVVEFGRHDHDD